MKKNAEIKTADQLAMAAARKAHFANGGTLAMWRGKAATLDEAGSKANLDKKACRGKVIIED